MGTMSCTCVGQRCGRACGLAHAPDATPRLRRGGWGGRDAMCASGGVLRLRVSRWRGGSGHAGASANDGRCVRCVVERGGDVAALRVALAAQWADTFGLAGVAVRVVRDAAGFALPPRAAVAELLADGDAVSVEADEEEDVAPRAVDAAVETTTDDAVHALLPLDSSRSGAPLGELARAYEREQVVLAAHAARVAAASPAAAVQELLDGGAGASGASGASGALRMLLSLATAPRAAARAGASRALLHVLEQIDAREVDVLARASEALALAVVRDASATGGTNDETVDACAAAIEALACAAEAAPSTVVDAGGARALAHALRTARAHAGAPRARACVRACTRLTRAIAVGEGGTAAMAEAGTAEAMLAHLPAPHARGEESADDAPVSDVGADEELRVDVVRALTLVCGDGGAAAAWRPPPVANVGGALATSEGGGSAGVVNAAGAAGAEGLRALARAPDAALHRVAARGAQALVVEVAAERADLERVGGTGPERDAPEASFVASGGLELLWALAQSPAADVRAHAAASTERLVASASFTGRRRAALGAGLPTLLRWLAPIDEDEGDEMTQQDRDWHESARASAAGALIPLLAVEDTRTEALARRASSAAADAAARRGHDGTLVSLLALGACNMPALAHSQASPQARQRTRRACAKALASLAAHRSVRPVLAACARVTRMVEATAREPPADRLEALYWTQLGDALRQFRPSW